jgi:hypothetical protein
MVIKIPSGISNLDLYKLANKVITEYELDKVNLKEYPILIFNKLGESAGLQIDSKFNEDINRVFVHKGSLISVTELIKVLGYEATVTFDNFNINIIIHEVDQLWFLNYLLDAISYLIFFMDLDILIEKLVLDIYLDGSDILKAFGFDILFTDPLNNS